MTSKLLIRSMIFGFTFALPGVASARRPPSLVAAQEQVDSIFATCPQGRPTSGYRDMLARFRSGPPAQESVAKFFTAAPEKMRDHIVLSCSGGTVHSGSGYRDMLWRFPADNRRPVLAGPVTSPTPSL